MAGKSSDATQLKCDKKLLQNLHNLVCSAKFLLFQFQMQVARFVVTKKHIALMHVHHTVLQDMNLTAVSAQLPFPEITFISIPEILISL